MSQRDYAWLWLGASKTILGGGGGATAGGGNVLLRTPPHRLDGPEHLTALDSTTLDATTTEHGLLPKLSGDPTDALLGDGTWGSPVATGDFLTKIEGGQDTIKAHGSMGSTETIDSTDGNVHTGTLNAACTITLNAPVGSGAATLELYFTQDGTGGWAVTWPGSVTFPAGTSVTTTAGTLTRYVLETLDGGTTWYGNVVGGGGSALTVKNEGSNLDTAVTSIDFVGALVNATNSTHAVTVTVNGALDDLTDVTITSATTGQRLRYNGSAWVNSSLVWTPLTVYNGTDWLPLVDGSGNAIMAEA